MSYILEVNNLVKTYEGFKLDDLSFKLERGTIMGLIGENGSGKTTTINSILNIVDKNSGSIKLFGQEMTDKDTQLRERISVVFEKNHFYEKLQLYKVENILKNIYKNWDSELFHDYIERFDLPINKKISELSKGMQMKFMIAIALSHKAELLILDEATSGLDPIARIEVLDILLDFMQDENNAILFSSHITSDLEKIADYITFISKGKLVFSKSKDDILYNYAILRVSKETFKEIEQDDIEAYLEHDFAVDVLINDKDKASKKYFDCNEIIIDSANIDEIMLLFVKGVRK